MFCLPTEQEPSGLDCRGVPRSPVEGESAPRFASLGSNLSARAVVPRRAAHICAEIVHVGEGFEPRAIESRSDRLPKQKVKIVDEALYSVSIFRRFLDSQKESLGRFVRRF